MAYDLEHEYTPLERLRLIAEAVGSVPDKQIYLGSWRNECGTTACALGWGILKFGKQLGMSIEKVKIGTNYQFDMWVVHFDGKISKNFWEDLGSRLGIDGWDAEMLFGGWSSTYVRVDDPVSYKPTAARIKEMILRVADRYEAVAAATHF